jgi:hypothetical protein
MEIFPVAQNIMYMKKYIIYHIPGKKIGCTSRLARRMEQQGNPEYEILEEHTDIDKASQREIELQKEYGYKIDTCPYSVSVENRYKFPDDLQCELSSRVKNRFKFDSDLAKIAGKNGTKIAWTEHKEKMLEIAKENVKSATAAAAVSPNRASLQVYYCVECDREIKGCGAAGQHRKKHKHNVNKKI